MRGISHGSHTCKRSALLFFCTPSSLAAHLLRQFSPPLCGKRYRNNSSRRLLHEDYSLDIFQRVVRTCECRLPRKNIRSRKTSSSTHNAACARARARAQPSTATDLTPSTNAYHRRALTFRHALNRFVSTLPQGKYPLLNDFEVNKGNSRPFVVVVV